MMMKFTRVITIDRSDVHAKGHTDQQQQQIVDFDPN